MRFTLSLVVALAPFGAAWADPPSNVTSEGVIHVPAFDLPVSSQSSPQAQAGMRDNLYRPLPIETSSIPVYRATIDQYLFQPGIAKAKARYPVWIEETHVAGVHAFYVTPHEVAPVNHGRILINVHGGGYRVGGGSGGLVEAIPIAGVGHIKVLTLDYSMGPEVQYPTATRELVGVYKFLLNTYKPENIGIYGCSAGGSLTASAVSELIAEKIPLPAAVGIFCSGAGLPISGEGKGGDSAIWSLAANGQLGADKANPASGSHGLEFHDKDGKPLSLYADTARFDDPIANPVAFPAVLAKFPPVLLMSGARAPDATDAMVSEAALAKVGVDVRLHMWEGMWHTFMYDPDLPEAQQAYAVTARFFAANLGHKPG